MGKKKPQKNGEEAYKLLQDVHDEVGNMEDELARLHADVKHMLLSL